MASGRAQQDGEEAVHAREAVRDAEENVLPDATRELLLKVLSPEMGCLLIYVALEDPTGEH